MRAWDIPGWNTGAKIRRTGWHNLRDHVYALSGGSWWNNTQDVDWNDVASSLLENDDWELYQEPKKKVKVKMYRPVFPPLTDTGRSVGHWREKKQVTLGCPVLGWQETEIEYEEI